MACAHARTPKERRVVVRYRVRVSRGGGTGAMVIGRWVVWRTVDPDENLYEVLALRGSKTVVFFFPVLTRWHGKEGCRSWCRMIVYIAGFSVKSSHGHLDVSIFDCGFYWFPVCFWLD